MSFSDALKDALEELWRHKLRTALTLLGMVFGVGAVIAMLSIGEGAEQEALRLIKSMGLNNVLVNAKKMDEPQLREIREYSIGLSLRDIEVAKEALPFIDNISAEKQIKPFIVFSKHSKSNASVFGVTPSYFNLSQFATSKGRLFDAEENMAFRQVAVLGAEAEKGMFPEGGAVGSLIKVDHVWLKVIGVLKDDELSKNEFEGIKLGGEKNRILIPFNTARKKFRFAKLDNEIDTFRVQVDDGIDPVVAANSINRLLLKRHGEIHDFEIVVPARLMEQHRQTRRIFTIVMSCIAGISLLVGGIGIMNIMLATVFERTREIGLLRAVGARKVDILNLFVIESFVVAALGGLLGIFLGFVIAHVIASFADWNVGFSFTSILLSVGFCALIGLGFGLYPAIKASRMDPILALQRE